MQTTKNHPTHPFTPIHKNELNKNTKIDLLFKNNRIFKHMTNFKTSSLSFMWTLRLVSYRKEFFKKMSGGIRDFKV